MSTPSNTRTYAIQARSTETFGRVLCSARQHHFVIDGPAQSGCPGEELGPGEIFLAGIASCGVELVQVLAREQDVPLQAVRVGINGIVDRSNPVRPDLTLFNSVLITFELRGVTADQGNQLIEAFKRR